jgi:hypothetical protein
MFHQLLQNDHFLSHSKIYKILNLFECLVPKDSKFYLEPSCIFLFFLKSALKIFILSFQIYIITSIK